MLIELSRGATAAIQKGAHVLRAPLPSGYPTELSQAARLGEGTSLQRPGPLRDASTLHPCYSSARPKKFIVLCRISDRQNFANALRSAAIISAPVLVIEFRGKPMANILRKASGRSVSYPSVFKSKRLRILSMEWEFESSQVLLTES